MLGEVGLIVNDYSFYEIAEVSLTKWPEPSTATLPAIYS